MEMCYYDQEYCMDIESVLQTYRNNIKVVFLYFYCFFVFNCFINLFTVYLIRKNTEEHLNYKKEQIMNKNKKSWFIDYSVE